MTKLLKARDAADLLSLCEHQVRILAARGEIPSVRLGKRALRFDPDTFSAWLRDRQHRTAAEKDGPELKANRPLAD